MTTRLITWYSDSYRRIADITVPRMGLWSARNNITFSFVVREPFSLRYPYWTKLDVVREAISVSDTVIWMDADMLIIDMNRTVDDLTNSYAELVLAKDFNGICAGMFMLKKSGFDLLNAWITAGQIDDDPFQDQGTIKEIVKHFPSFAKRTATEDWIIDDVYKPENPFAFHSWGRNGSDDSAASLKRWSDSTASVCCTSSL